MANAQPDIVVPIDIVCADRDDADQITSISVPLPQGTARSVNQCTVMQCNEKVDAIISVLGTWIDGSFHWIKIEIFSEDLKSPFELLITSAEKNKTDQQHISQTLPLDQASEIDCGNFCLLLGGDNHIIRIKEGENFLFALRSGNIELSDAHGRLVDFAPKKLKALTTNVTNSSTIGKVEIECSGTIGETDIATQLNFYFYPPTGLLRTSVKLHNPNRAIHKNGHWDLGDPNSFYFSRFAVGFIVKVENFCKISTAGEDWRELDGKASLIQFSSGGENWQSPVHLDRHNRVPISRNGFEYTSAHNTCSGKRASPCLFFEHDIRVGFPHFWQNFPKAIFVDLNKITYDLFPALEELQHELQAGEKKTHEFWVDLTASKNKPSNRLPISNALTKLEWLTQADSPSSIPLSSNNEKISQLIENGLESKSNFLLKREQLDGYGWRNFGDLYADHETSYHSGKDIFVSHYNNQYDPILGFLKQYIRTQKAVWLTLADDLAKHVKDIDIYDTKLDKIEYNQGLFWHTDHYLPAYTSSHRSYSCCHQQGAYEDHAGGGGPGGQHCYTTGLTLHYWLTGEPSSKQAVLDLTEWITHLYEGQNTCLELALAVKNRNVPGCKNQLNGQYPLDRGIANYLNALFDSFELTQDKSYINRCEHIIQNTVHPNDDINSRNLNNVEYAWFYTVFLQALYRYLDIKSAQKELDDKFYYARDTLLHYADWMLEHESPYLDKPDILEYPNDTWTAQDLRKACVFAAAWYYDPKHGPTYLDKAKEFETYVADKLSRSAEKAYTRILALLMLNDGVVGYYQTKKPISRLSEVKTSWPPAKYQLQKNFASSFMKVLVRRLSKLSLRKEIIWLTSRLS